MRLILFLLAASAFGQVASTQFTVLPSPSAVGEMRFRERASNGVNYLYHRGPDAITSNAGYTWPVPATGCFSSSSGGVISIGTCLAIPIVDTTSIVEGSADGTKELRFEVDGFTTGTIRVLTPQNIDYVIAGLDIAQTFTANQAITGTLTVSGDVLPVTDSGPVLGTTAKRWDTVVSDFGFIAYDGNRNRVALRNPGAGSDAGSAITVTNNAGTNVFTMSYAGSLITANSATVGNGIILTGSMTIGGNAFVDASRNTTVNDLTILGTCTGCISGLPVIDTTSVVEGSADGTKELRFEVDGFTTATVRVLTPQNADYIIAGTNVPNTFSVDQTFSGHIFSGTVGTKDIGTVSNYFQTGFYKNVDAAPSGVLGTYVKSRQIEIADQSGGTSAWTWYGSSAGSVTTYLALKDQGGVDYLTLARYVTSIEKNEMWVNMHLASGNLLGANDNTVDVGVTGRRFRSGRFGSNLDVGTVSATSGVTITGSTGSISAVTVNVTGTSARYILGTWGTFARESDGRVFSGTVAPKTDNTYDLGDTAALRYRKAWLVDLDISGTCTGCPGVMFTRTGTTISTTTANDALVLGNTNALGSLLRVDGGSTRTEDIFPDTDNAHDIGASTLRWNDGHIITLWTSLIADFADSSVDVQDDLVPLTDSGPSLGSTTRRWDTITSDFGFIAHDGTRNRVALRNPGAGSDSGSCITVTNNAGSNVMTVGCSTGALIVTGQATIGGGILLTGAMTIGGNAFVDASRNTTTNTLTTLSTASFGGNANPSVDSGSDLGSTALRWDTVVSDFGFIAYDGTRNRVAMRNPGAGSDAGSAITVTNNAGTNVFTASFSGSLIASNSLTVGNGILMTGAMTVGGNAFVDASRNTTVNNLTILGTCTGCADYWTRTGAILTTATASDDVRVDGHISINTAPVAGMHIEVAEEGAFAQIRGIGHGTGFFGLFKTMSSRGTIASPTATQSGDTIGFYGMQGRGATGWGLSASAAIRAYAAQTFTDSAFGTHMVFEVATVGATSRTERMRITEDGTVLIGLTTDSADALSIVGNFKLDGGSIVAEHIRPDANATSDLGQSSFRYRDQYLGTLYVTQIADFDDTSVSILDNLFPVTDSAYDLGSTSKRWINLYAASGVAIHDGTRDRVWMKSTGTVIGVDDASGVDQFRVSASGSVFAAGAIDTSLGYNVAGSALSDASRNITINNLTINGTLVGSILPGTDNAYDLGSSAARFNEIVAGLQLRVDDGTYARFSATTSGVTLRDAGGAITASTSSSTGVYTSNGNNGLTGTCATGVAAITFSGGLVTSVTCNP